ncbi:MAG: hypothetical protein M1839_001389 [Geoglossum umbratile]|nr:MAG: hypothetical protein M1839_001389 [Geoglossum umbratile]
MTGDVVYRKWLSGSSLALMADNSTNRGTSSAQTNQPRSKHSSEMRSRRMEVPTTGRQTAQCFRYLGPAPVKVFERKRVSASKDSNDFGYFDYRSNKSSSRVLTGLPVYAVRTGSPLDN